MRRVPHVFSKRLWPASLRSAAGYPAPSSCTVKSSLLSSFFPNGFQHNLQPALCKTRRIANQILCNRQKQAMIDFHRCLLRHCYRYHKRGCKTPSRSPVNLCIIQISPLLFCTQASALNAGYCSSPPHTVQCAAYMSRAVLVPARRRFPCRSIFTVPFKTVTGLRRSWANAAFSRRRSSACRHNS